MGKAKFSSLISIQHTGIEALLGARLGAGCWAYGMKRYLSFVPQELTNQETDHKDMCSVTVVHDKGTTLLLCSSNLTSWTMLWPRVLCAPQSPCLKPFPHLPLCPHSTLCLAKPYSSFSFQLRCHFFQENAADHPNLRRGLFRAPTTPLNQPLPLCGIFIIQREFPAYSSISPCRLRSL